jgi:hypothetical protein
MFKTLALAGVLSLLATSSSSAVFTAFTDRASFVAALTSFSVEDFNGVVGEPSFNGQDLTIGDITLRNDSVTRNGFVDQPPLVSGVAGTTNIWLFSDNDPVARVLFTFASPITAFGAEFFDFNDFFQRSVFEVLGETITPPVQSGITAQFFGFPSDMPFTSVTIAGLANDSFSADNVTYGSVNPIPLPAPALILLSALGGLTVLRRARRG